MSEKVFSVGIDLGTTNSTLAICSDQQSKAKLLEIAQIEKPGVVSNFSQLPSALYLPFEGELNPKSLALPWGESESSLVTGHYAKARGADAPDRVILSAKSWLCNASVDRKEAILPWKSEIAEEKLSPFTATVKYLEHIRASILKNSSIDEAEVVVCVPASFDEVARTLTADAVKASGFKSFRLLEEPLAALYSWLDASGDTWREQVAVGDIILVCDIGGGTADFTTVIVGETEGKLSLERVSVGDHILLGGDNMDLALAYQLRAQFESEGKKLDTWQFQSLIHHAQKAKERFLVSEDESLPITLASKGSSLFASTIQTKALREQVLSMILDGFFPKVSFDDLPGSKDTMGLQEYGLPFEAEPALTKHLAKFLKHSAEQAQQKNITQSKSFSPNAILFNGGVCKSPLIRERILEVLKSWDTGSQIKELPSSRYDHAVAEGAASYARMRRSGEGLRIKAGTARSYYLGIETSMPAVPGFKPPVKGVCVVPSGMEEGTELTLEEQTFSLLTGREVEFRFFTSHERGDDLPGFVVDNAEGELEETSRLRIALPKGEQDIERVKLRSKVSDVGTLELTMNSVDLAQEKNWKLEFDVRAEQSSQGAGALEKKSL